MRGRLRADLRSFDSAAAPLRKTKELSGRRNKERRNVALFSQTRQEPQKMVIYYC